MTEKTNLVFVTRVCLVAALGGMLFGYDTGVIAGAIGFLQTHFQLSGAMKGWVASSALLGCVMGVALAGIVSDYAGRKKIQILSAILFLVSALGTAVAESVTTLVVYRLLGGIGVGIASIAAPMYIAEISPARIRGRMVSVNQFAIVSGMLITYFVNYFIARGGGEAWNMTVGWRWMFASESIPSILYLLLLFSVPESPRWLVEQGRVKRARTILVRIAGPRSADAEMQMIGDTVAKETQRNLRLFAPEMRFVLFLGVMLAILQQVTGINVFLYYGTEIFKQLGSVADVALLETVLVGAVNLTFTLIAIWTVDRLGRRPLMMLGSAGMGISLLAMGAAAQFHLVAVWMLVFILGYIACFALSVGPVTWVILSEMFPNSIRGRAMSLAALALWTSNFLVSQTFPMMDENPWLVARFNHGFPFYVYGAFCALLVVVVWRGVPETKGQSLEEIENHWTGNHS